jgi:hypothetical protein
MKDECKWEVCEEEDVAYIVKVPMNQTDPLRVCVGRKLAKYLKDTGQIAAIEEPAKYPIEIVNESCKDGKPIKKELLGRIQFCVDRYGNHHYDIVYIDGVPYLIPLPH